VLSDVDILMFFLGPIGWICLILLGALWLGIVALEMASLTGVLCAEAADRRLTSPAALRFAAASAWPVLRLTARMVAWTLLAAAPFLAVAAVVYFTLLTAYDINYYLQEKPPVFLVAVGIGAVIVLALTVLLLRLFTGWFFALPLVLFEGVQPADALRVSRERARGHRRKLVWWIVGWFLITSLISTLATGIVGAVGHAVVPRVTHSLHLLAIVIGALLIFWAVVTLAINLLSTTTFAAVLFNLYRHLGSAGHPDTSQLGTAQEAASGIALRITRGRLIAGAVIGVLLAAVVGAFAVHSVQLEDNVQIMAHRGSSKAAPENTMAAIRKAIDDGADWVEIDVQETADGEVVLFHDSDFMKLAGVDLKIWDATLDDLQEIDIGSWFAPEFRDERVPTLAEVLDACKGKIRVNIELKYYGHDVQLEQRVADIVASREMDSDVIAMSLKMDGVRKMKAIRPEWRVGLLMSVAAGDLKQVEADFLAVNAGFANRRLIRTAHESGREVYVWTVNDAPTMSSMISRGADGLLTDRPALARSVLEQRAQMSPVERLLLELAGLLGGASELGEP
jgi:glycerophosphoryl diester phosphodiesterase